MPAQSFVRGGAMIAALTVAGILILFPALAQSPVSSQPSRPPAAACAITPEQARFDFPLPHTARQLASGKPIKIVALGSSSTYGTGASSSAAAYPSRLAEELTGRFPGHEFIVLNRGVNGEEIDDMLRRLDKAV